MAIQLNGQSTGNHVWTNGWRGNDPNAGIPSTYYTPTVGFTIRAITLYNNSPAALIVSETPAIGVAFPQTSGYLVPAFYPITLQVPGWRGFAFKTDGTAVFAASTLQVVATDSPLAPSTLSPFGPSGWGAGSVPNVLANVNPGDPLLAWQIQQVINLLTGIMTGQAVAIKNVIWSQQGGSNGAEIRFDDRDGVGGDYFSWYANAGSARLFTIVGSADLMTISEGALTHLHGTNAGYEFEDRDQVGGDFFAWYSNTGLARLFSSVFPGDLITVDEAGNTVYLNNTTLSWKDTLNANHLIFQGLASDNRSYQQFGTIALRWTNDAGSLVFMELFASGGLHIGVTSVDPGANNVRVQGRVTADATGSSAKQLLNWVPLASNSHAVNGTGNQSITAVSLSPDVPASAVMVAVEGVVAWNSAAAGTNVLNLGSDNPQTQRVIGSHQQITGISGSDFAGILPIASQQLFYSIAAGVADTWTVTIRPTAYAEPS